MTSIEWLIEQFNQYRPGQMPTKQFKEVCEQAIKMHRQEVTNCNHLEISDEEIEKAADVIFEYKVSDNYYHGFQDGAKWYREQLKQRQ